MEMGVEYDMCAMLDSPTHRFWIAPALMANGYTEYDRANLKNTPLGARPIRTLFGGVQLDFVLETGDRPVSIDYQSSDSESTLDKALGAQYHGKIRLRGSGCNKRPGAFEERRIRRRHQFTHTSIAGNEAFRKADELGVFSRRFSNSLLGQRDRFVGSRRELDIGERESKYAHSSRL